MQPTPLEQAVFRTLAWFSIFSYPLTIFEVWKWLLEPDRSYNLSETYRILDESVWLSSKIEKRDGFVALIGKISVDEQVKERQNRFLDAVTKYASLRRAAVWFQLFPGVQAVAAANTMAWWHTNEHSDIDLYILTKPKMLWSSRLFLVAPFKLLGRRPDKVTRVRNPFCFSFFNTSDHLNLEALRIERDVYLAFWSKSLVPVFDKKDLFEKHTQANRWADVLFPHAKLKALHRHCQPRRFPQLPLQTVIFEPLARSVQRNHFPKHIQQLKNRDTRVVINDDMLKLYPTDRREMFRDEYESILKTEL